MKKWWLVILLGVVLIAGAVAVLLIPAPAANAPTTTTDNTTSTSSSLSDTIVVDTPTTGGMVQSPLTVTGKARGTFYFEATFPVTLKDASGNVIAQSPAQAQGDWMTSDFVPFTATLTFTRPAPGTTGTLELTNDNPSGDPAKQKTLDIPVTF